MVANLYLYEQVNMYRLRDGTNGYVYVLASMRVYFVMGMDVDVIVSFSVHV